jgi:hypothetical protein
VESAGKNAVSRKNGHVKNDQDQFLAFITEASIDFHPIAKSL